MNMKKDYLHICGLGVIYLFIIISFTFFPRTVLADEKNEEELFFIIIETYPNNDEEVNPNLICTFAGCRHEDHYDFEAGAFQIVVSMPEGISNRPLVHRESINADNISVSADGDENLSIRYSGESNPNNYYFHVKNDAYSSVALYPNKTYTVRIKGGSEGMSAQYGTGDNRPKIYLEEDYVWTFTTGDGEDPIREREEEITVDAEDNLVEGDNSEDEDREEEENENEEEDTVEEDASSDDTDDTDEEEQVINHEKKAQDTVVTVEGTPKANIKTQERILGEVTEGITGSNDEDIPVSKETKSTRSMPTIIKYLLNLFFFLVILATIYRIARKIYREFNDS